MRALRSWAPILGGILALTVILMVAQGIGLRWDPFDLQGRRLRAVQARAELAEANALARRAERAGDQRVSREATAVRQTEIEVARITAAAIQQARQANDATLPLAPDRVRRLDEHDRQLCRHAPALCAGTDTPEPAGGGNAPVPSGDPGA